MSRRVKNGKALDLSTLSEEEKNVVLARRAYQKQWRAENREKVRGYNERFFEKLAKKAN